jgi:30S ribosomal protein 3
LNNRQGVISYSESPDSPSQPADESVDAEVAEYALNFLWLDKNLAVSVDQVFGRGHRSPVTEYFFWPREDAWEALKAALEQKDWISHQDKVTLLNTCTEVINYWQAEDKPSVTDAIEKYPQCSFQG